MAANIQFFRVYPIHFAVENVLVGVISELLAALSRNGLDIEVVLAEKSDTFAVGRELRILTRIRRRRKLQRSSIIQVVEPQLTIRVEKQVFGVGSPYVRSYVVASHTFSLSLVFDFVHVRREACKLGLADKNLLLARGGVKVPEFPVIPSIVTLHEGHFGAIGAPLDVLRTTSGQSAFGEDGLDGERFGGSIAAGLRKACGDSETKKDTSGKKVSSQERLHGKNRLQIAG
jgi:hypothetical protein